jgi:prepilin-type N-terminal cleavage/methylation domain-containing protein
MNRDRGGFTLVELIIVTVLGALLIAVSLQVLITNQRTYTAQTAQIKGQQSTRAAMDVLYNELREISAQGGDILAMSSTSLTVRSMRKFGVVCSLTTSNPPVLTVLRTGDWLEGKDSVFVFADNRTATAKDDAWIAVQVTSTDTTKACGAQRAQDVNFNGQGSKFTQPTGDSVRIGAPVRNFVQYIYRMVTLDGQSYLGRAVPGAKDTEPLVGPLEASSGLEFAYRDANGITTTVPADVRQIVITVRTASGVINSVGEPVSDSLTAVIFTRN